MDYHNDDKRTSHLESGHSPIPMQPGADIGFFRQWIFAHNPLAFCIRSTRNIRSFFASSKQSKPPDSHTPRRNRAIFVSPSIGHPGSTIVLPITAGTVEKSSPGNIIIEIIFRLNPWIAHFHVRHSGIASRNIWYCRLVRIKPVTKCDLFL